MSDPVQADAGALAALRLLGERAKAAKGTDEKARWYATVTRTECWSAMEYQGLCSDAGVTREALAKACTPDVILALVQDAERYRFLRDNPLQLRAIDGRASLGGWLKMGSANFDECTDVAMLQARMEAMETDDA